MKTILILLISIFNLAAFAQDVPKTKLERKVTGVIADLPEVIKFNKEMLKQLKRPVIIEIESRPAINDPYYRVAVLEDFGDRTFPYWRFYVHAKTLAVYYCTFDADMKAIPIATWRKHGHQW